METSRLTFRIVKQKFKTKDQEEVSSENATTSASITSTAPSPTTPTTTSQSKPHPPNELEKWFDDGQLEDSKLVPLILGD